MVEYPNCETMGNNDKQCVTVFCDQWGSTLQAAPTLLTVGGGGGGRFQCKPDP